MIVWSYWPLPTGGAEAQCRKLSHELVRQGIACSVLTSRQRYEDASRADDQGVRVIRVPVVQILLNQILKCRRSPRASVLKGAGAGIPLGNIREPWLSWLSHWLNCWSFMLGAFWHLLRNKPEYDVLHVHIADWLAGYTALLGRWFKIPVVCKAANMPPLTPLKSWVPFRYLLDKQRSRMHFVALHDQMRASLIEQGVGEDFIQVIPNGVLIPPCQSSPVNGKYVLCVANFSQGAAHKAFDVLLHAWSLIAKEFPAEKLMMAGAGDDLQWKTLARQLGVAESVVFPGYVSDHAVLYGEAKLLVLPSRHEGISNVLLEAQAWGVPAIVSDIPGNRLVVVDGETGRIVPVGNVSTLAQEVGTFLKDSGLLATCGRRARLRVEETFSIVSTARAYSNLYQSLMNKRI